MDEEAKAYRVSEFCQRYKICRTTLYKEVNQKRLQLIKCGRRTLIARSEAERWFASLCQQSQPPETV